MDPWSLEAESNNVTLAQFKAKVRGHLESALVSLETVSAVPLDVFDPRIDALMDEMRGLDEFLYAFGRDHRRQQEREDHIEHVVKAKQREPDIEERLMWLDEQAQKLAVSLGKGHSGDVILLPMAVDLFVAAAVKMLDACPPGAFAPTRALPPGFASERDSTVGGIVNLMHQRRLAHTSPVEKPESST